MSSTFDQSIFLQQLDTQWLGHSIRYFEELESTNTYLKKLSSEEIEHGLFCLTDHQTRGRGQYERKWETEKGQNLTFSIAFTPADRGRFHVLTLACALAIVEKLNEFVGSSCAAIKWPNDIILNDKKTGGILTEAVFSGNTFDRLIIGIGLNINQQEFSNELEEIATSVSLEKGEGINREQFLADLLNRIEYKYILWEQQQSSLIKTINRNIIGYGQWVGLKIDDEMQDELYKLLGIDENGALLMLNRDGGIDSFSYEQIQLVTN
ncbi:biotin--[acetyl-CoA-carboxylase] ligase [Fodinibius sp.]|uniref:biotin--[acetyl-CoA-carboxylase] ligase n=1 Tax=Fodinibius sp. TaxID=1872440 RepID=UPI002ACD4EA2|nr:biotin--[acetyl-CoA-carboxylase] ligase [Fodinibius sp.]MDZ7658662.1 biotin--[acetyl-CoA-carboxylase] ligase [Fodinibius sp.]